MDTTPQPTTPMLDAELAERLVEQSPVGDWVDGEPRRQDDGCIVYPLMEGRVVVHPDRTLEVVGIQDPGFYPADELRVWAAAGVTLNPNPLHAEDWD